MLLREPPHAVRVVRARARRVGRDLEVVARELGRAPFGGDSFVVKSDHPSRFTVPFQMTLSESIVS